MYKSRVNATWFKGVETFFRKLTFWPLWPLRDLWPTMVIWHKCHSSGVLMIKSGWNRSKHVEAISLRSVASRKKNRSVNRSGHSRCCDPKWPQIEIWPHKIGRGSPSWSTCMSLSWSWNVTWSSYTFFYWKPPFDHSDPKWPRIHIWPHNIGRGSQVDQHVWVLWSCSVTWMSYRIFSENNFLTPVTPNDHRLTFDP